MQFIMNNNKRSVYTLVERGTENSIVIPWNHPRRRGNDDDDGFVVGRQANAVDLRIVHGSISRKHAIFYYVEEEDENTEDGNGTKMTRLFVKDLGGKHGTSVNGQRIQVPTELHHQDTIVFGKESVYTVMISNHNTADTTGTTDVDETNNAAAMVSSTEQARQAIERAGQGLTGRMKRQAEIAAMMESLNQTPIYQPQQPSNNIQEDERSHGPLVITSTSSYEQSVAQSNRIPIASQFTIASESHRRRNTTTCIAIDPAGARFAVGSMDTNLRLYDFGGMDRFQNARAFKTIIPDEGYGIVDACYSNTGDRILVGTGSVQPLVLDREGETIIKFMRGDMYVTDQTKTVGHTAAVTAVDWHPLERDIVLTASLDGSARLCNLHSGKRQFDMLTSDKVFVAKNSKGQRTAVTVVTFHPGGREFALGTTCGSIQIWNTKIQHRPERVVFATHNEKPISSLVYSFDGSKLASRSAQDDSIRIWNAPKLSRSSEPCVVCKGAPTDHEQSNIAFSPDAKILCVPVSQLRRHESETVEQGFLNFYDVSGENIVVEPLLSIPLATTIGPIVVRWHPKLSQIFVGCSNGQTIVYYDTKISSSKGAGIAVKKSVKKVDELSELLKSRAPTGSAAITGEIIAPLYHNQQQRIKRKKMMQEEPISREPERPETGKHKVGGQVGGVVTFQQLVADQSMGKEIAGKDPREALFKYKDGKSFVDRAYQGNVNILAEKTAEQEEEERKRKR
jgi:WD40 repeat protein